MKRKLLLIMPNFFDYPQAICEELEKMGDGGMRLIVLMTVLVQMEW